MTTLLEHSFAQSTEYSFLLKQLCGSNRLENQSPKKCPIIKNKLFQKLEISKNNINTGCSPNLIFLTTKISEIINWVFTMKFDFENHIK